MSKKATCGVGVILKVWVPYGALTLDFFARFPLSHLENAEKPSFGFAVCCRRSARNPKEDKRIVAFPH
jgi:hypothetical protein